MIEVPITEVPPVLELKEDKRQCLSEVEFTQDKKIIPKSD